MAPKVIVSYCQHDEQRDMRALVRDFANRLLQDGIDAMADVYLTTSPPSWTAWMHEQLTTSDFVLVLCTEEYKVRAESGVSGGAAWEAMILTGAIYENRGLRGSKVIPITLGEDRTKVVPYFLDDTTAYDVTGEQYFDLLGVLLGMPAVTKPPLGRPPQRVVDALRAAGASGPTATLSSRAICGSRWGGHREIFRFDSDGRSHHSWSDATNEPWVAWAQFSGPNGPMPADLAAASFRKVGSDPERLDVYALMPNGAVLERSISPSPSKWSGWTVIGDCPSAAQMASSSMWAGHRELFVVRSEGGLIHNWSNSFDEGWSGWVDMEIPAVGGLAVAATSVLRRSPDASSAQLLFLQDRDGAIWLRQCDPESGWGGWVRVSGGTNRYSFMAVGAIEEQCWIVGVDTTSKVYGTMLDLRLKTPVTWAELQTVERSPVTDLAVIAGADDAGEVVECFVAAGGDLFRTDLLDVDREWTPIWSFGT